MTENKKLIEKGHWRGGKIIKRKSKEEKVGDWAAVESRSS